MTAPGPVLPFPVPAGSPDRSFRDLVEDLWTSTERAGPDLLGGLIASSSGLADVLDWAAGGAGADETAAVWLQNLRWARAVGIPLAEAAPVPPPEAWERRLAGLGSAAGSVTGRLAEALAAERMQYPSRSDFPDLDDDAFFPRLVPLSVYPQASVAHLGQLAVNLTALTHGSGEALASGLVWALLLRCALGTDGTDQRNPPHQAPTGSRIRAAVDRVRSLLVGVEAPDSPTPTAGLRAAMAATGSSLAALHRVVDGGPRTKAWLLGEPVDTASAPGCLLALARAVETAEAAERAADRSPDAWAGVLRACLDRSLGASGAGESPRSAPGSRDETDPARGLAVSSALRWAEAVERWAGL